MKIICHTQGDDRWWEARQGIPSASSFHRIYAVASDKMSDGMDAYIAELVEDMKMQLPNFFTSQGRPITKAMQRGHDLEPLARKWYEQEMGYPTHNIGFGVTDCGRFGCSPDFLWGDDKNGVVGEIKNYSEKEHAKWMHYDAIPAKFMAQVLGQLIVTGRPVHHFVLWNPDEAKGRRIIRTFAAEKSTSERIRKLRVALEVFDARYAAALKAAGLERRKP